MTPDPRPIPEGPKEALTEPFLRAVFSEPMAIIDRMPEDRRAEYIDGMRDHILTALALLPLDASHALASWLAPEVVPVYQQPKLQAALRTLMEFGKRLMDSEVMEERGIGSCICESARVIEADPA